MQGLYVLGLGCIIYSAIITLKYANMSLEQIDVHEFHKTMNKGSIIAGIGSLAFIYEGLQTGSYLTVIFNFLALALNVYFFKERNMKSE